MFSSTNKEATKISLQFWGESIPFRRVGSEILLDLCHFGAVLVVNDRRPDHEQDENSFKIAVYSIQRHKWPCVLLKLTKDREADIWDIKKLLNIQGNKIK